MDLYVQIWYTILMWKLLSLLTTLVAPNVILAAPLPIQQINITPCTVFTSLRCAPDVGAHLYDTLIGTGYIGSIFGTVLFASIIYFGVRLILMSRNDSAQAEAVQSYVQALIGTIFVAGASSIASVVLNHTVVIDTVGLANQVGLLGQVALFIRNLVVGLLILNLFIQGFKMIIAQDEGETSAAQKGLIRSVLGTVIVMICGPIINAIVPSSSLSNTVTGEIVGIANFIVTIFGALAALAFVVAGAFYVLAVDASLKDRAHKLMISSIVAVLVVLASYSLLHIFY